MGITAGVCCLAGFSTCSAENAAELLEVRRIWDQAAHSAFTDLIRFKDGWVCAFREGTRHVSPDGAVRVIISSDGREWTSSARLVREEADLRDPKLVQTPQGRLMLTAAAALNPPADSKHQTLAWFSSDGWNWSEPAAIGDPNFWLWRVGWHKRTAYGIGYGTDGQRMVRLYASKDVRKFEPLVETLFDQGDPNEAALLFREDDSALCVLRRDGTEPSAQLGKSNSPFKDWTWHDLGVRVGGPQMIQLPDSRIVVAARRYDGTVRTSLMWLHKEAKLQEFLALPSGGDTSYPGLVWHEDSLWVSYYSSHEGKASIYLAKVKVPGLAEGQP